MFWVNLGDLGWIPGSERSPGEGNGNPLQYSCLKNPMDRGAWWATVHRVAKSRTRLSDWTELNWNLDSHMGTVPATVYAFHHPHPGRVDHSFDHSNFLPENRISDSFILSSYQIFLERMSIIRTAWRTLTYLRTYSYTQKDAFSSAMQTLCQAPGKQWWAKQTRSQPPCFILQMI